VFFVITVVPRSIVVMQKYMCVCGNYGGIKAKTLSCAYISELYTFP